MLYTGFYEMYILINKGFVNKKLTKKNYKKRMFFGFFGYYI